MESKDVVRALLWAAAAFFMWQMIAVRIWPPPVPATPPDRQSPAGEVHTADRGAAGESMPPGADESERAADADKHHGLHVASAAPQTLTIGDASEGKESPFRIAASLTTAGASIVDAQLSDFDLYVDADSPRYPMLSEVVSKQGKPIHSFTTSQVYIGEWDATVDLGDADWAVESRAADRVVFGTTVLADTSPVLHVRKTFLLPAQDAASQRHEMAIVYELENRADQPLTVILTQSGPVGLRKEDLRFEDRSLFRGVQGDEGIEAEKLANHPDRETPLFRADEGHSLAWTAVANKYFAAIDAPRPEAGHDEVSWINEVKGVPLDLDAETKPMSTPVTTTTKLKVDVGQTRTLAFDLYLGPKDRKAFRTVPEYVRHGYDELVLKSYSMGACAFLTPQSFVRFMIWMLNTLKAIVFNYGIAIIILVLIVRTLLHPITKKGQVNMMRMQQQTAVLQPKMEEIKKRFANDKQKQSQEIMKLYQEEGVNPATGMMSSCLPMFLQMPIWVALFTSLNYNIDMRHEPFCLWIHDLAAPDALIRFATPIHIPLISAMTGKISSFNLLPILVSIAMFAQQKLMPKPGPPPGQSDEKSQQAAQMQKMMPFMTLFFGLLFYNMPSGLNLYIGASSFFGAIEQHRIRKHIEELKKRPPPPKNRPKGDGGGKAGPPGKPKRPSIFERMRKAAEEAQKLKSARPQTKPKKRRTPPRKH